MPLFLSLSSGSNGNCYYLGEKESGIIIDIGIGVRCIKKRLLSAGIDLDSIKAVLISHDHFDHIRSLGTYTEKRKTPVYTTREVIRSFERHYCTKGYMSGCCKPLEVSLPNLIELPCREGAKDIEVIPFRVPHDATDTVGFHIKLDKRKITFITDIGNITEDAVKYASDSDYLIIEANYDVDMLIRGNYPPDLKLRIMQGYGHLSNEQTACLLKRVTSNAGCHLKKVFLCHLSENNNTPETAYRTIKKAIPESIALYCLPRRDASDLFEL